MSATTQTTWPPARPEGGCALVTGGSGSIGAATVHALAADGWPVVVHYGRGAERAEAVVAAALAMHIEVLRKKFDNLSQFVNMVH